ncbi:MAG: hypothetical protein HOH43_12670 [Candidatus Latescibacteria bacterium]|jgi:hypothetical protein|nr:hypothetical protein [Candidatus Latescibacterota bacterium]
MELTQAQRHHQRLFEDFGYLHIPGVFADDADWIIEEYERVLQDNDVPLQGTERRGCSNVIEGSARLCTMIDNPVLVEALSAIMGDDFNYLGSSGELMVGDGMWHPDGRFPIVRFVKVILYLDHLTQDTGALRLVPGSHLQNWPGENIDTQTRWGISDHEMPCVSRPNAPGDVVLFNQNTLHNSLNGGNARRLLVMGFASSCHSEEEISDFKGRYASPQYSDIMLETAGPERMRHLRQPLELSTQK